MLIPMNLRAEEKTKTLSGLNLEDFSQGVPKSIDWGKNPFLKPVHDVAVDELLLTGIVYREDDRAALINGRMIRKGDKIGTNEVVEIEPERVILRNENGIFELSLKGR